MEHLFKLWERIDSSNSEKLEESVFAEYELHGPLVLDADELAYISSAGLRVLLKLRKKQGNLEVINVSSDVNEILEVTGFSDMLTVRKKLRQVSVENCELIGKGGNGSV